MVAPTGGLGPPPSDARTLAAAVGGHIDAVSLAGGHDLLHGSADSARALGTLVLAWLERRL